MADRTIVALYERLDDAHAAMHELVDMGVLQDEITIGMNDADGYRLERGGATAAAAGTAAGRRVSGGDFIQALGGLYVPEEDARLYAEGVRRGGTLLTARVAEDQLRHALDILERHNPVDIDERETEWRSAGWTGRDQIVETGPIGAAPTPDIMGTAPVRGTVTSGTTAAQDEAAAREAALRRTETRETASARDTAVAHEGEARIPIVEEEVKVGKRQVGGGRVRVHTRLVEQPVHEQVQLREEHVHVERHPVDRPADRIPPDAFQEKTIEVTESREEAVVSKTARVTEEVVVGKDVDTRTETVSDTVRRTEVEVEDERKGKTIDRTDRTGG